MGEPPVPPGDTMKSVLLPLALCVALAGCATYAPPPPAPVYAPAPLVYDPATGTYLAYDPYAYPYYAYPSYAYPYWYGAPFFSASFFCCASVHHRFPRHGHRMDGRMPHGGGMHWGGGRAARR
jgi:hypothetical protein